MISQASLRPQNGSSVVAAALCLSSAPLLSLAMPTQVTTLTKSRSPTLSVSSPPVASPTINVPQEIFFILLRGLSGLCVAAVLRWTCSAWTRRKSASFCPLMATPCTVAPQWMSLRVPVVRAPFFRQREFPASEARGDNTITASICTAGISVPFLLFAV